MTLLGQVLRLSLPLVLAALAETVSERGGVVNLGIEGMMLAGAFFAWLVAAGGGPEMIVLAWFVAAAVGAALGCLSAWFAVTRRCDHIVTGTAVHFLCFGGTGILFERCKRSEGVQLLSMHSAKFTSIVLPYSSSVRRASPSRLPAAIVTA